jgi:PTS system fructose-specific IIC component
MWLDRSPDRVRRNVGLARLPQAGVTIGLLLAVQSDPALAPMLDLLTAVVLAVVTLNEVVGPILARVALLRSGEAGMDRTRLIDFLHEENIVTKLAAATPEQAIERLTQVLVESHQLPRTAHAPLLASVLAREAEVSTVLGGGLMIPHGVLEEGERMLGVMGLSAEGLRFPSPDGQPVHCVVLLATPRGERDRHLEVLAALASSIGRDPDFAARLFAAQSSAHAYEILHDDEAVEGFNYFLDEAPPRAGSPAGGSGAAK